MTPQSAFMVLATLRSGRRESLESLLEGFAGAAGHADPEHPRLPFGRIPTLHDARFVILDARTSDDMRAHGHEPRPWHATLQFSGDCDGPIDDFFRAICAAAGPAMLEIFSHCERPPVSETELVAWLEDRHIEPAAYYVNRRGRTVSRVRENRALRQALEHALPSVLDTVGTDDARAIRRALLDAISRERAAGRLTLSDEAVTPTGWRLRHLAYAVAGPVLLLAVTVPALLSAPVWLSALRLRERLDPELVIRPDPDHDRRMAEREDIFVTNQFVEFGDAKPGLLRKTLARLVLFATDWFARHVFHRGHLARIRTIHQARWVFVDDGHRLVFTSTYDGSREAYMDDFMNKVGWGLNATFSHFVGYPRTRWMLKDGASRETPFKYGNRRHQLPSVLWYNAYPDLTVVQLERDRLVRRGVDRRPLTVAGTRRWLELLR